MAYVCLSHQCKCKSLPRCSRIQLQMIPQGPRWNQINSFKLLLSDLGVSKNSGTPKSSILIGFSLINHPFWGTPIFGNTHLLKPISGCSKLQWRIWPRDNPQCWTFSSLMLLFGFLGGSCVCGYHNSRKALIGKSNKI